MRTRSLIERAVALALAANAPFIVQAQTSASSDVTVSRELDEVTVTATRRETSLQDAFREDLEAEGIERLCHQES